ncbi:MAG: hypothetical protein IPM82_15720 [Saprospiraceae bacterium]|nr:hypothetical protein [Saprospiraceae bacterium]
MRIFFLFAIVWLTGCSSGGPVEVDGIMVESGLRAFADGQHFDYTGHLDKALKGDDAALEELLKFSAGQDSAASVGHGLVMKSLLGKLGDELFSQKIAAQPEEVKHILWAGLEQAGAVSLKNDSPLTLKALMPTVTPAEHRGLYVFDAQNSSFRDCAEPDARYLVVDETGGNLEKNYRRLLKFPYPGQPIFAVVKGYKTPYFGNQVLTGDHAGFFVVTEIIELEAKNYRNTCIPYEFWALGTEPFWYAQVSAAEGVIEYRGMDDERTKVFAYQPPVEEEGGMKIYTGVNQDSGDNIRIVVDSVTCSDGMSDVTYKLGVKLTMNGKELKGCGIPFEAGQAASSSEGNK